MNLNAGKKLTCTIFIYILTNIVQSSGGRRGRDRIVGFTTTCAISAYHHLSCEFEPRSWRFVIVTTFLIMFVSDFR